jgi:hypothetical protein
MPTTAVESLSEMPTPRKIKLSLARHRRLDDGDVSLRGLAREIGCTHSALHQHLRSELGQREKAAVLAEAKAVADRARAAERRRFKRSGRADLLPKMDGVALAPEDAPWLRS